MWFSLHQYQSGVSLKGHDVAWAPFEYGGLNYQEKDRTTFKTASDQL